MIMNGQKSRSLTWAGCAGLTAFGLLLLPLLPVRGQQPERKEAVIVIDGKDFKIHFGGGGAGGPDQEAVELLKRALKLLGEKKTPPTPGPATPPGSPEEVKKAREQVDALTQEVAAQRRQMEAVEAKLRDAKSRLAKLEGKKGGSEIRMLIMPSAPVPPVPPAAKRVPTPPEGLPALRGLQLLVMPDGKAVIVSGEKKEKASAEELTKRLERLQHEVEQLRREIQQAPPADVRKRK
jgi:prefoldin subunit 5